jgi:hypothetical protein
MANDRVPDGFVGLRHSVNFRDNSSLDLTWRVASGALPPGLTLEPGGTLHGTPESGGSHDFTIEGRILNLTTTRPFSMIVTVPSLDRTEVMSALLRGSGLTAIESAYLDFVGNRNNSFDLGDVRAWLQSLGALPSTGGAP